MVHGYSVIARNNISMSEEPKMIRGMLIYFSFDTWDRRSFVVHLWSLDLFTLMVKELVHAMLLSLVAESGEGKLTTTRCIESPRLPKYSRLRIIVCKLGRL